MNRNFYCVYESDDGYCNNTETNWYHCPEDNIRYIHCNPAYRMHFTPPKNDAVNHPSHYCKGGIECIEAIRASMSPTEFQGYCKGNVQKYIWRYPEKAGLEDLKKAEVYLRWMIESVENQKGE